MTRGRLASALVGVVLAAGAGCAPGRGTLAVTVWGEEYVTQEIPAAIGDAPGFENGWSLRFTKFLVNIGNVTATAEGAMGASIPAFRVYDLVPGAQPIAIGSVEADARRLDRFSYDVAAASAQSAAGNAGAADVQLMQTNRYAMYFEATATHATRGAYRLRWGFTQGVTYLDCRNPNGQPGVVVPPAATATAQLTIHADHFFYDDLESDSAQLRFDAIADADRDGDREVTLDELAMVDLSRLPAGQYGTGSAPNVRTLRDFVGFVARELGHLDGEGTCRSRAIP